MRPRITPLLTILTLISACAAPQKDPPATITQPPATTSTPTSRATTVSLPPAWTPTQTLVPTNTPTITVSPTITLTPTKVNTRTPGPTRTEHPQIAALAKATLKRSDLPPDYEQVPISESEMQSLPLLEEGLIPLGATVFTNADTQGSVLSIVALFEDLQSQQEFDRSIEDADQELADLESQLGLSDLGLDIRTEVISDFPPIADKSVALRIAVAYEGLEDAIEIAMFRRGNIGAMIMIYIPSAAGQNPDLATLAQRLDSHIVTALAGGS